MKLTINGESREVSGEAADMLLWVLRDELEMTGTKFGCGAGICGACTVHVDGVATRSCITPLAAVEGKAIRTIEGLATGGALHPVQQAFIDEVVPHELAHLLVWKHFGRVAPHGKEWKWMMESVLGVPALRTHRFELDSVRKNTFSYRCQCQQHQLTVRRHNRVMRGEATYRCVRCGDVLVAEK